MTEQQIFHGDRSPKKRSIDSLGLITLQLRELETQPPEEVRGFFYSTGFKPVLRRIISTVAEFGVRGSGSNVYLDHKELVDPENPDLLTAAVHFKRTPSEQLSAFLLHAYSVDESKLAVFLPLRADGQLKKVIKPYVMWEGAKSNLVDEPELAVSALAELTTRIRSSLQVPEPISASGIAVVA